MVTIIEKIVIGTDVTYSYVGKSTDEKPFSTNGSQFLEMDTGKEYFFDGDEKGWSEQADKYLDSIAIETAPTKTTYYVGDKFDATGTVIKATYTAESTADITDVDVEAPEKLELDSIVKIKYVENGRTRYAEPTIEIKDNKATDKASFMEIAQNGSAVVLEDDITISGALAFNHDFELDLNGNELTTTSTAQYMMNVNGGTVTLKNGAIKAKKRIGTVANGELVIENCSLTSTNDLLADAVGKDAKITVNGGEFHAVEGGFGAFDGASIEVNGGSFEVTDNFALYTNGSEGRGGNTIIINDIDINNSITSNGYEACGIYVANDDTFIMNGGKIVANGGCGILQRGGHVTINDGYIKGTDGANVPGWIGDLKGEEGKMSASGIVYHKHPNYASGKIGIELTINGGTIIGATKSIDIVSDEVEPKVYINGGAFIPPYVPVD